MKAAIACFLTLAVMFLRASWRAEADQSIALVPQPSRIVRSDGQFTLTADTKILVDKDSADAANVGKQLAERINRSTGLNLAVLPADATGAVHNAILLTTKNANAALGAEGYTLEATPDGVVISAAAGPGLFYGMQTLLQLLPPQVFSPTKVAGAGHVVRAGRADRRPAAIPLAGADAGRLAPLLQQGRGQELHRPDGPAQDEHLPLAPDRRSRLADRDQAIPQAHGGRRLAEGHPVRTQSEGRHGVGAGRAVRRLLHPGRHPRDRRLRQRPLRHDRARNRDARPLGRGAGGLSRVQLHGQARRPQTENAWPCIAPATTPASSSSKGC